MKTKLGVGIIGCGGIAGVHVRALAGLADRCSVVAVSDPIEEIARARMAESGASTWYPDYRRLLADDRIDLVTIATPHYLHAPMAVDAARAGKHIFVEKPMALTVGQTQEMLAAAHANGVRMTVSSELANPVYSFVKQRVLPEIGMVTHSYLADFYLRDSAYYRRGAWRGKWATEGGGVFINQAIYTWHPYTWLLGGVDVAYGYWANLMHPEIEVEDLGYGLVKFGNGLRGKLFCTTCCDAPAGTRWLEILGSRGSIYSDVPWLRTLDFALSDERLDGALHTDMQHHLRALDEPPYSPWALDDQTCRIRAQLADLLSAIQEGREPFVTGESGAEPIKILDGLHWNGWQVSQRLRDWLFERYDLAALAPAGASLTVEDGVAAGWRGGQMVEDFLAMVKSPSPWLEAPFLA